MYLPLLTYILNRLNVFKRISKYKTYKTANVENKFHFQNFDSRSIVAYF